MQLHEPCSVYRACKQISEILKQKFKNPCSSRHAKGNNLDKPFSSKILLILLRILKETLKDKTYKLARCKKSRFR